MIYATLRRSTHENWHYCRSKPTAVIKTQKFYSLYILREIHGNSFYWICLEFTLQITRSLFKKLTRFLLKFRMARNKIRLYLMKLYDITGVISYEDLFGVSSDSSVYSFIENRGLCIFRLTRTIFSYRWMWISKIVTTAELLQWCNKVHRLQRASFWTGCLTSNAEHIPPKLYAKWKRSVCVYISRRAGIIFTIKWNTRTLPSSSFFVDYDIFHLFAFI